MNSIRSLFLLLAVALLTGSCGIYSFTGASIPADARTFTVNYLPNVAPIVNPALSQLLAEKLKTKFLSQTTLKLASDGGDLLFSGKITGYATSPVAVQGNQTSSVNRLTISVEITFDNKKDPTKNFTSTFTQFSDFPSAQNLAAVENDLVAKITDQLVQDIFNKAVINW